MIVGAVAVMAATTFGAGYLLTHLVASLLLFVLLVALVRVGVRVHHPKGLIVALGALLDAVWLVVTMMDYPIMAVRALISIASFVTLVWALLYNEEIDEVSSRPIQREVHR